MSGLGVGTVSVLAGGSGGFLTVVYLDCKNVDIKRAIGTSAAMDPNNSGQKSANEKSESSQNKLVHSTQYSHSILFSAILITTGR